MKHRWAKLSFHLLLVQDCYFALMYNLLGKISYRKRSAIKHIFLKATKCNVLVTDQDGH
jgi:hypothetical protein